MANLHIVKDPPTTTPPPSDPPLPPSRRISRRTEKFVDWLCIISIISALILLIAWTVADHNDTLRNQAPVVQCSRMMRTALATPLYPDFRLAVVESLTCFEEHQSACPLFTRDRPRLEQRMKEFGQFKAILLAEKPESFSLADQEAAIARTRRWLISHERQGVSVLNLQCFY